MMLSVRRDEHAQQRKNLHRYQHVVVSPILALRGPTLTPNDKIPLHHWNSQLLHHLSRSPVYGRGDRGTGRQGGECMR